MYVSCVDPEYCRDWLTYAGHVTNFIVGYGSDEVEAFCETMMPEPDVIENVVVPFCVDNIPPCNRPVDRELSSQRSRVVFV